MCKDKYKWYCYNHNCNSFLYRHLQIWGNATMLVTWSSTSTIFWAFDIRIECYQGQKTGTQFISKKGSNTHQFFKYKVDYIHHLAYVKYFISSDAWWMDGWNLMYTFSRINREDKCYASMVSNASFHEMFHPWSWWFKYKWRGKLHNVFLTYRPLWNWYWLRTKFHMSFIITFTYMAYVNFRWW